MIKCQSSTTFFSHILNSLMHCFSQRLLYTSIKKCPFYLWHFTNIKYIFTSSNKSWYFTFLFKNSSCSSFRTYSQRNPLNQTQTVVILRNVLEISIFESKRLSPSIFKNFQTAWLYNTVDVIFVSGPFYITLLVL